MKNNVHKLISALHDAQIQNGKTEAEANSFVADYLTAFLAQLYQTERSVAGTVDTRLKNTLRFLEKKG